MVLQLIFVVPPCYSDRRAVGLFSGSSAFYCCRAVFYEVYNSIELITDAGEDRYV